MDSCDSDRLKIRSGFGNDAMAFDRTRPVCPAELFNDLVCLAGLEPGDRVLEIGCGTGQATVPLAERGMAVTAIELDPDLAGLATAKLTGFDEVKVVTSSFEDWTSENNVFDAVVALNSLHWVDPDLRYSKPAQILNSAGTFVVAGCRWSTPNDADSFWTDVQQDYRAVGFAGTPPPPPELIGPDHLPSEAGVFFEEVAAHRYPFSVVYSSEDYLANLASQSGTRQLGEEGGREFLARVKARLASLAWPPPSWVF